MSLFLIQQNTYNTIYTQPINKPLFFIDISLQTIPTAILISTNREQRLYFICIQVNNIQNIQVALQMRTSEKYFKFRLKPLRFTRYNGQLIIKSQRCIIELSNELQYLTRDNKYSNYKLYINNHGNMTIQITYHLQQFSNQYHANYLLTKTINQVTQLLQTALTKMLSYLNIENTFIKTYLNPQNNSQFDHEELKLSHHDKIKYLSLLHQVYKSHRNNPITPQTKPSLNTITNNPTQRIEFFSQTNTLQHQDIKQVQYIEKKNQQFINLFKQIFKLINPTSNKQKNHLNMSKMHLVYKQFEKYVKKIRIQHLQIYQLTSMHFRIVKGIQNHKLISDKKMLSAEGAHSVIYLGTYKLHLSDTLFTYQYDIREEQTQKKAIVKPLITKKVKDRKFQSSVKSFQNQLDFLHHVKDKRSKFIATYFLPLDLNRQNIGQIFSQLYHFNLKQYLQKKRNKSKLEIELFQVLQLAQNILFALIFMVENCVLHRDLKPFNIMIDQNLKARLIDFGSCCPLLNGTQFSVSEPKILTTPGYQLRYKQCPEEVRKKYLKLEYDQHILYDIYSYGSTLKQMLEYVDKSDYASLSGEIDMMIAKCQDPDPMNRVSFDELLYYIKILKQIVKKSQKGQ